jgi:hypothetical protein
MAACTRFLSAFFSFGEILGTFLDLLVFVLTTFSVLKIVSRRDLATGPRIAQRCLLIPVILFVFIRMVIGIPLLVWRLLNPF